jgi:hypothetical protein
MTLEQIEAEVLRLGGEENQFRPGQRYFGRLGRGYICAEQEASGLCLIALCLCIDGEPALAQYAGSFQHALDILLPPSVG